MGFSNLQVWEMPKPPKVDDPQLIRVEIEPCQPAEIPESSGADDGDQVVVAVELLGVRSGSSHPVPETGSPPGGATTAQEATQDTRLPWRKCCSETS